MDTASSSGDSEEKDVETASNCSYEETCAKIETVLRRELRLRKRDVTKLPGYQETPANCPAWKKAMIEKKNKQIEEDALREHLSRKHEEERWKDIPEWKRVLIVEKEKKKQEELAPFQAERRRMEGEMQRLQNLPEWKRNLILKKRGDAA